MVVIRFRNPRGIDFPYLVSMIHDSFMSRANSIVIPGGKLDLAMQLILTPHDHEAGRAQAAGRMSGSDPCTDHIGPAAHRPGTSRTAHSPTRMRALAMDAVREGQFRPSRHADGHGRRRDGPVHAISSISTPPIPRWPDRDRFILSAGHGSMLLYALLYLTGSEGVTLDELKRFRQLGATTAGHPEYRPLPGRRDHHRAARAGHRQRRRHGACRADDECALRQRSRRSPHLCHRRRRLPDGRHQP